MKTPPLTHTPRNAMLLGIAATVAGVGALMWKLTRQSRETRLLRPARSGPPGNPPVWAQATAIVASSASALLLLVRTKGN